MSMPVKKVPVCAALLLRYANLAPGRSPERSALWI